MATIERLLGCGAEFPVTNATSDQDISSISDVLDYMGPVVSSITGSNTVHRVFDANAGTITVGTRGGYIESRLNSFTQFNLNPDYFTDSIQITMMIRANQVNVATIDQISIVTDVGSLFISLRTTTSPTLNVGTSSLGTQIGTTAISFNTNTWYWFRMSLAANGDVKVDFNGNEVTGNIGGSPTNITSAFFRGLPIQNTSFKGGFDNISIGRGGDDYMDLWQYGNIISTVTNDATCTGWTATGGAGSVLDALKDFSASTTGKATADQDCFGVEFPDIATALPNVPSGDVSATLFGFNIYFDNVSKETNASLRQKLIDDNDSSSVFSGVTLPLLSGRKRVSFYTKADSSDYLKSNIANLRAQSVAEKL